MSFELEGKLIEKFETVQVTGTFRKREFVVEKKEVASGREFIETIKFQLVQDRCDQLENFQVGHDIKVSFNIKGRRWEKDGNVNYFNNLEAWRLEAAASGGEVREDVPPPSEADFMIEADDSNDDLPF